MQEKNPKREKRRLQVKIEKGEKRKNNKPCGSQISRNPRRVECSQISQEKPSELVVARPWVVLWKILSGIAVVDSLVVMVLCVLQRQSILTKSESVRRRNNKETSVREDLGEVTERRREERDEKRKVRGNYQD